MIRTTLEAWLDRLEQRSPEARVDLGLERVRQVFSKLALDLSNTAVVTVAGTNGKGSTVAYLEAIYCAGGKRVLAYTSPHLLHFSERFRIDQAPASEAGIVHALETVEQARGDVVLTYFEHITLAALVLAAGTRPDVLLLEVGLGGRLDAVNVVDPDVAVLTSIGLDHTEWLGRTRRAIGREKAGIARRGKTLIVGERRLPSGFADDLQGTGARVRTIGSDFRTRRSGKGFRLFGDGLSLTLPQPSLAGRGQVDNAACAVLAAMALKERCPLPSHAYALGLQSARVPGRQQVIRSKPLVVVDVAHNPAAARQLAASLGPSKGNSMAVFAALSDKDIEAMGRILNACFDHWLVAGLEGPRGLSADQLAERLRAIPVTGSVEALESVPTAVRAALRRCGQHGRVAVVGSFRTVADAWPELETLG